MGFPNYLKACGEAEPGRSENSIQKNAQESMSNQLVMHFRGKGSAGVLDCPPTPGIQAQAFLITKDSNIMRTENSPGKSGKCSRGICYLLRCEKLN